jgi:hypothetical protein
MLDADDLIPAFPLVLSDGMCASPLEGDLNAGADQVEVNELPEQSPVDQMVWGSVQLALPQTNGRCRRRMGFVLGKWMQGIQTTSGGKSSH